MKRAFRRVGLVAALVTVLGISGGCSRMVRGLRSTSSSATTSQFKTLADARRGFKTEIVRKDSAKEPVEAPPPNVLQVVRYPSPAGKLAAYLTPPPRDGKKHPAIVWITGGDCNTIGDVWSAATPDNDQTAWAFRDAGIVTMYPSLRGGNENPGYREGFYGEVNDVLAAADYLAKQPGVDPKRIYLGGHSTGGTLVLLTSELSPRFRAVFSFGPIDDVTGYGEEFVPADLNNEKEMALRSPGLWLNSIQSPTFVFEGDDEQSNIAAYRAMYRKNDNRNVHFFAQHGADHFSVLAPTNKLLAKAVARDTGSGIFVFNPAAK